MSDLGNCPGAEQTRTGHSPILVLVFIRFMDFVGHWFAVGDKTFSDWRLRENTRVRTVHQGHGEKEQVRHRPWALNPGPPRVHGAREPSTLSPQGPCHTLAELGMQDVYIKMSEEPVMGLAV